MPGYQKTEACRLAVRERVQTSLKNTQQIQLFRELTTLKAALILTRGEDAWSGGSHRILTLDGDLKSDAARAWMRHQFQKVFAEEARNPGDTDFFAVIPHAYRFLLEEVDSKRCHISAKILAGCPKRARQGLGDLDADSEFEKRGLSYRKMREADVSLVTKWKKEWFEAHPEYGAHCAFPSVLAAEEKEMKQQLAESEHDLYIIEKGSNPVGYFAFVVFPSVFWGSVASLDFQFTKTLRRTGLARYAYSILVDRMRARGVRSLRGGTSQPGVLSLAKKMGRPPVNWIIRPGPGHFSRSHFLLET